MRLIKKYLTSIYKMKDLNEVDIILGIKVNKNGGFMLYANLIIL